MVNYRALVGRQWEYGKFDCYTLMRDWFELQGIELPDFARPDDLEACDSIFLEQMPVHGFLQVEYNSKKPGDVLIMRLERQHQCTLQSCCLIKGFCINGKTR